MVLIKLAIEVFYSFFAMGLTCELCERLMDEYDDIGYVIYQFDWYLLPIKVQKTLPTIIINAQRSIDMQCFGSTNANRESFQKVNNSIY